MTKRSGRRTGRRNKGARSANPSGGRLLPVAGSEYQARTTENLTALRMVKATKGPNHKYINGVFNAINAVSFRDTNPIIQLLNGVAQGTGENARIGRLTKNRWLDIDLDFFTTSASAQNWFSANCRWYIVAETTALGSAVAAAQFFLDAANFTPTSQRDRTNRNASRYIVLHDSGPFVLAEPPHASGMVVPTFTGVGAIERSFSKHLMLEFQTDYSRGNAGTVADIDTNSLYLLCVTDHNAGANDIVCTGSWTLCFDDDS